MTDTISQATKTIAKKSQSKLRLGVSDSHDKVRDSQITPKDLYDALDKEFHFDFDPCPVGGELTFNGLQVEWGQCNYVNPPFSEISEWLIKGNMEMVKGKRSIFLIPFRSNTKYWENYVFPVASEIRLFLQPVKFEGFERGLPICLALVVMDPAKKVSTVRKQIGNYTTVSWNRTVAPAVDPGCGPQ